MIIVFQIVLLLVILIGAIDAVDSEESRDIRDRAGLMCLMGIAAFIVSVMWL